MNKAGKIHLYYTIFLSIFTVVVGALFIFQAADIYYSAADGTPAYTPADVGHRLALLMIPVGLWIAAIVGGVVLSVVFPVQKVARARRNPRKAVCMLNAKLPQDVPATGNALYKKLEIARIAIFATCAAFSLLAAVMCCVYLFNTARFPADNINGEVLAMLKNVLPWVLSALVLWVAAAVADFVIAKKQLPVVKQMVKENPRAPQTIKHPRWHAFTQALRKPVTLWVVRGTLLAVAITFVTVGALNGGARDVLIKAINICTECIGLG